MSTQQKKAKPKTRVLILKLCDVIEIEKPKDKILPEDHDLFDKYKVNTIVSEESGALIGQEINHIVKTLNMAESLSKGRIGAISLLYSTKSPGPFAKL